MFKRFVFVFVALSLSVACTQVPHSVFTGETLRIDYYQCGDKYSETAELVSLTRTSQWYGPVENMVDTADLGDYRVILKDVESDSIIYLNGFSTLFGEWRTTLEAMEKQERYYMSLRVPMPAAPSVALIEIRNKHTMEFSTIGTFDIDPAKVSECNLAHNEFRDILINGGLSDKVDLTFISEGYTAGEMDKYIDDVNRFTDALFACPPFDKRKADFNVRAVMVPSEESGVDFPGLDVYKNTALNAQYYTFGTDRYLTTSDMKAVGDAVWDVPTDAVFILVNEEVYGGGGIYNYYAIGSSDNHRTLEVFLHEFGHSFGALADEYFESTTPYDEESFYDLNAEPWEPNITTLVDFDTKWGSFHNGLYEGGGYLPEGIYRPEDHCMMRDFAPFCPVCSKTIERNIDFLCDK